MEIRIISYEDSKKYCSSFFLAHTKEAMVNRLLGDFNREELEFEDMKKIMSLIDTLDYEKWLRKEIVIQTGSCYCMYGGV